MDVVSAPGTYYPGTDPVINSFTASDNNSNPLSAVQPGDQITFNFNVSGDSYDYIDNIGPQRLTANGAVRVNTGSVMITPTQSGVYALLYKRHGPGFEHDRYNDGQ